MKNLKKISVGMGVVLLCGMAVALALRSPKPTEKADPPRTGALAKILSEPTKENVSHDVKMNMAELRDAVKSNPRDAKSAFELARLYYDGHNLSEAARFYELGLKTDRKNDSVRIDYSLCLYTLGKKAEAKRQNQIVLTHDPNNVEACYNMGAIHANDGAKDSAVIYWTRIMKNHPGGELEAKSKNNIEMLSGYVATK